MQWMLYFHFVSLSNFHYNWTAPTVRRTQKSSWPDTPFRKQRGKISLGRLSAPTDVFRKHGMTGGTQKSLLVKSGIASVCRHTPNPVRISIHRTRTKYHANVTAYWFSLRKDMDTLRNVSGLAHGNADLYDPTYLQRCWWWFTVPSLAMLQIPDCTTIRG
jgi:hypothetical protein